MTGGLLQLVTYGAGALSIDDRLSKRGSMTGGEPRPIILGAVGGCRGAGSAIVFERRHGDVRD
jgi:hypothetical protein